MIEYMHILGMQGLYPAQRELEPLTEEQRLQQAVERGEEYVQAHWKRVQSPTTIDFNMRVKAANCPSVEEGRHLWKEARALNDTVEASFEPLRVRKAKKRILFGAAR